jgi:hypothetical protein
MDRSNQEGIHPRVKALTLVWSMDNVTSGMGAYGCMNFPIVHINMVTSGLMKQGGVSHHCGPAICIKN